MRWFFSVLATILFWGSAQAAVTVDSLKINTWHQPNLPDTLFTTTFIAHTTGADTATGRAYVQFRTLNDGPEWGTYGVAADSLGSGYRADSTGRAWTSVDTLTWNLGIPDTDSDVILYRFAVSEASDSTDLDHFSDWKWARKPQRILSENVKFEGYFKVDQSQIHPRYLDGFRGGAKAWFVDTARDTFTTPNDNTDDAWPGTLYWSSGLNSFTNPELRGAVFQTDIPTPIRTTVWDSVPKANVCQGAVDVDSTLDWRIYRPADSVVVERAYPIPLEYFPNSVTGVGDKILGAMYQYYSVSGQAHYDTQFWFTTTLTTSPDSVKGTWTPRGGNVDVHRAEHGRYIFSIPEWFGHQALPDGERAAFGRHREGQGGSGPPVYAMAPWSEGNPPADTDTIPSVSLLRYGNFNCCTINNPPEPGEQHAHDITDGNTIFDYDLEEYNIYNDYCVTGEYAGGAFATVVERAAMIIVPAVRSYGCCWYRNQALQVDFDCHSDPFTIPGCDPVAPSAGEGNGYQACVKRHEIFFYDVNDIAGVALGTEESYAPQPYMTIDIDSHIFPGSKSGINGVAYDETNDKLYLTMKSGIYGSDFNQYVVLCYSLAAPARVTPIKAVKKVKLSP